MAASSRRRAVILGGCVVAIGVAAVLGYQSSRARITGDTAEARIDCIARIADEGANGAAEAIAAAAINESDATVRRAALFALGRYPGPTQLRTAQQASQDADPAIRAEAAGLLAKSADPVAADRLKEMATNDSAEPVRLAAIDAMERSADDRCIVALVEIMAGPGDPVSRASAMNAMCRRMGVPRRFDPADTSAWDRDIEIIKSWPKVQAAFAAAARPLPRRPELIPPMPHGNANPAPERSRQP